MIPFRSTTLHAAIALLAAASCFPFALGFEPPSTIAKDESYRTWTSGQFFVEARYLDSTDRAVLLERRDGKRVEVELERLSAADRAFVAAKRKVEEIPPAPPESSPIAPNSPDAISLEIAPPEPNPPVPEVDRSEALTLFESAIASEEDSKIKLFLKHMRSSYERGGIRMEYWASTSKVTRVPKEIGLLTHLEALGLIGQNFTELPPEFGNLRALKNLNLSNTQLTRLPTEFGYLENLEFAHFTGSKLTGLPPEIGRLRKLGSLQLADNQITTLPPELVQLQKLLFLNLKGNPITDASLEPIMKMNSLISVNIKNTKVTREGAEALRKTLPKYGLQSDFE